MHRNTILAACVVGFLSVAGGAFGAHALEDLLTPQRLETYEIGTQYARMHAPVLLVLGLIGDRIPLKSLQRIALAFVIGVTIFTGSLWVLAITGVSKLGMVTPFCGVFLLLGWLGLAATVWRLR